ncbi:MAG: putative sigma-54 modulation protein [Bacteroidia bacterium]|jgi:putative sigma-54 modulation protein
MDIRLQAQDFDITPAIEAHVRREVSRSLANASDYVTGVDVFLSDINGPRGGEDKKARIRIRLASRLVVHVEKVNSDLYVAMSVAARRARHTVKRTLRKYQRIERAELRKLRKAPAEFQDGSVSEGDDPGFTHAY